MTETSSTRSTPQTDSAVSMSDQLLMVCPTEIPKYSLMSQKPASLTCEKKTEPQPIARTSNAAWAGGKLAATGSRMPAAVTVATVAEPVANRMTTATSQAISSGEIEDWVMPLPSSLAIPVSTRICLNPPPAATMSTVSYTHLTLPTILLV